MAYGGDLESPAAQAAAVTPDDDDDLAQTARALYVGTGGSLKVDLVNGGTVTFVNVPDGSLLPIRASKVYAIGTTAADIIALW